MQAMTVLAVAGGGALGACCRYSIGLFAGRVMGGGFFYGTLLANLLGSFCLGLVLGTFGHQGVTPLRSFLAEGFCGALTTFSTFSLETALAAQAGDRGKALLNVTATMALSLGGVALGVFLAR